MSRKQRTIFFLMVFWSVVLGVPCFLVWQEDHQQRLNEQLLNAIKCDDTATALRALERGANANARNEPKVPVWKRIWMRLRGRQEAPSTAPTPLLLALQYRQDAEGAGGPPKEHPELVRALVAHGAHVNKVDAAGYSLLWWALATRSPVTARIFIEHGANVRAVPGAERGVEDLPSVAIVNQDGTAIVAFMLEHGADPNWTDATGCTPLSLAVFYGDTALVRCLLAHHADPNQKIRDPYLDGLQPLAYAKKRRLIQIAKRLQEAGARE